MDGILPDPSVSALAAAIEANHVERFRLFQHWPQAKVHDDPDVFWVGTDIPFALFNFVLRAQYAPDTTDAAGEAVIARYAPRHVPMFWLTGSGTRPANLKGFWTRTGSPN